VSTPDPTTRPAPSAHEATSERQWHVAQLGAREHYAVPRALARRGALAQFYTDAWCRWGRSVLRQGPDLLRAFANRYHHELSSGLVTAFSGRAIWNVARRRLLERHRPSSALADYHVEVGRWFASRVRDTLKRDMHLDTGRPAFFGFSTGSLEVLRYLEGRGIMTVLDQVSPGQVEYEIVREEVKRWPGWIEQPPCEAPALQRRVAAEWDAASLVLVNSEWSRSALVKQGVPADKIIVVPGAYESPPDIEPTLPTVTGPLRVLWLGSVVLRKGIPYLVAAARALEAYDVEVTVAGPVGISEEAVRQAPGNVTFTGAVPRDQVSALYQAADVFVLPTLSDGFGITQVEAMAHGCPVVATPNCGRVVTDGVDGSIVPPRDVEALTDALAGYAANRNRAVEQGRAARQTAQQYTLDVYAQRLLAAVHRHADGSDEKTPSS